MLMLEADDMKGSKSAAEEELADARASLREAGGVALFYYYYYYYLHY